MRTPHLYKIQTLSAFLMLRASLEERGGTVTFLHKYLVEIAVGERLLYVRLNERDQTYQVTEDTGEVWIYRDLPSLEAYILRFFDPLECP